MPYIKQEERTGNLPKTPGQLNFAITELCHAYIQETGGVNYTKLNEVIGVLMSASMELYRQVVAKYEDQKKQEHGSVSELDK